MVKISKEIHVKAKKGQILVLVLMLMAVGLIVISPLLHFLNTSYNIYLSKLTDTSAYYAVDAMMGQMFTDMYTGKDIYILNKSSPGRYNNQSWLNGYKISTSINNSIAEPPPPPSGENADWLYVDPGCAFGLNSLESSVSGTYIHPYELALTENNSVTVNWYFKDTKSRSSCHYWCIGKMWITYENGSTVKYANGSDVDTGYIYAYDIAFQQQLSWLVPEGGSGDYIINFQHKSTRGRNITACTNESTGRSMSDMEASGGVEPTFSGIGDPLYTWVRLGNAEGYQFQDYTITSTASLGNTNILSVTACVRQSPGPHWWWEKQSLAVVNWVITYY